MMKAKEPDVFDRVAGGEAQNNLLSGAEDGILDNRGDGALDFERIEDERSNQQNLEAINPYLWTGYQQFTRNCGNCAVANELRHRGLDVEAQPGLGMHISELADMFDGATVQYASMVSTTDVASEMIPKLEQHLLKWGEGARGAIRGENVLDGNGHLFSLEIRDGVVKYDDGQIGKENVNHLERMKPQSIAYVRLDNTKPNDTVINAVKNRR
ncbi:MAG: hypothetical protein LBB74_09235 [Chitinispirillales bacterium]|nr:hypothetical protein [Chitinispirillales bacterium]